MWKTKVFHASFFSARADKPEVISISILLFCSIGMISPARMHPYWTLLLHRDYFTPVRCISIWLFCSTGIISPGRMHLYLALLFHRDYFARLNASLSDSFAPQGLLYPGQMHLYRTLLCRRDYFARPDASHHWKAIAENISARPFRQIQRHWSKCRDGRL